MLEETEVDNSLEHLFSLESLGFKTSDQGLVSLETNQVKRFEEGITFRNGHYNVELLWHLDKIYSAPSNHQIAIDRTLDFQKETPT